MALVRAVRLINNITGGNYTGATLNSALGNPITLSDYEQVINVRSQARNLASSISGVTTVAGSTIASNELVASPVGFYEVFYSGPALAAFVSQTPGFSAINNSASAKALVKSSFLRDNSLIGGLSGENLVSWVDGSWLLTTGNLTANEPINSSYAVYGSATNRLGPTEAAFWGGDTYYKTWSSSDYTIQGVAFTNNFGQTWTNPTLSSAFGPTGNRIMCSYANGYLFVTANGEGSNGNVYYYTQSSGLVSVHMFGSNPSMGNVAYGNGRYVVLSSGTEFAHATSLTGPWTSVNTLPMSCYRVYFENDMFFLIGSNSQVATSPDGVTWTMRSTTTSAGQPRGFFFKNNRYFVAGASGVMSSADGITWSYVAPVASSNVYAIEYFNSTYYAMTQSGYATSTNGTTWTKPSTISGLGLNNNFTFYDAKVVGGVLYLQATNRTILSLDGATFTSALPSIAGCVIATKKTGNTPATTIFQDQSRLSYGFK